MRLRQKTTENLVKHQDWEEVSEDSRKQGEDRQIVNGIPSVRSIYNTLQRKLIRAPHMNSMKLQHQQLVAYLGSPDFWKYVSPELLIRHQHINEINQVSQDVANLSRCQGCQSIARSNCTDCRATCWDEGGCAMSPCQTNCEMTCYQTSCKDLCSWRSTSSIPGGL